jgi:hypothetical protein
MNPIMNMLGMGNAIPPQIMQLAQLMRSGGNSQAMMSMLAQQYPEMGVFLQMPNSGTPQGMEQLCKNLCQQRGLDFNNIYQQAQNMMKQLNM